MSGSNFAGRCFLRSERGPDAHVGQATTYATSHIHHSHCYHR